MVNICDQEIDILCDQHLRVGEGKYFDLSFVPAFLWLQIGKYIEKMKEKRKIRRS